MDNGYRKKQQKKDQEKNRFIFFNAKSVQNSDPLIVSNFQDRFNYQTMVQDATLFSREHPGKKINPLP